MVLPRRAVGPQLSEAPGYEACFLTRSANPQGQQIGKSPKPQLTPAPSPEALTVQAAGSLACSPRGQEPESQGQFIYSTPGAYTVETTVKALGSISPRSEPPDWPLGSPSWPSVRASRL